MSDFGELVLVIGDFHIPQRASGIPEKFQRMFVPNKMQHVLCTGNLSTKEQYDELRSLAPNVHVVRGSFDDNSSFPDTKVIQIGQFKVGLVSGHQVVPWGDSQSLAMVRCVYLCCQFCQVTRDESGFMTPLRILFSLTNPMYILDHYGDKRCKGNWMSIF